MNFGKNKITFMCARIIEIASLMETLNFPFIEFGIHLIKKNKIRAQSIIILKKKAKIKYIIVIPVIQAVSKKLILKNCRLQNLR